MPILSSSYLPQLPPGLTWRAVGGFRNIWVSWGIRYYEDSAPLLPGTPEGNHFPPALWDSFVKVHPVVPCGERHRLPIALVCLVCFWCTRGVDSTQRRLRLWGALFLSKSVLMLWEMNGNRRPFTSTRAEGGCVRGRAPSHSPSCKRQDHRQVIQPATRSLNPHLPHRPRCHTEIEQGRK